MVHSGFIFCSKKVCKRRRFLSDTRIGTFPGQSSQDPFRPKVTGSGGPSLPSLIRARPVLKVSWLPPESGNMRITRLCSAEGPKVTIVPDC